ncbi:MAG: ankyrin repeat domain-containing protein [Flavobacteriaceae bacterium]|jgi:ankyrin repeat protein|nr:ankyrin repeat domain-containing protein [Flavobacteriaceae bacterium]
MIKKISIFLVILTTVNSCKHYLPGYDYELFKDTPVYQLAKAVESDDLLKINHLVKEEKMKVNYREPKFGNNLLMLAIVNQKEETVKTLLDLGADPNLKNTYSNDTALTVAIQYMESCNLDKIKLLVAHGADVNTEKFNKQEMLKDSIYHTYHVTVLKLAASKKSCINLVKYLVDKGANINLYASYEGDGGITSALIHNNLDVALYLIKHPSTKIPDVVYIRDQGGENEQKLSITDMLEEENYSSDPKKQKYKEEILSYLKSIDKR